MPVTPSEFGLSSFAFPVVVSGGSPTVPPASSMTVTDNTDGTGGVATIAGSAGVANDVYAGKITGETGPIAFSLNASRTGDGTLALTLSPGLYLLQLVSAGFTTQTIHFAFTNSSLAVATRCRRSVCDTIRLLAIPCAARVYEQSFPDPSNVAFPCVLVTVDGVSETDESGLSTRDDVGRPVKVQIADRRSKSDHDKLPDYEAWRQAIERCFRNQQLTGVPESKICRIESYVILDPNLPQYEYMVSGLVVRAVCREPRGVGV